MHLSTQPYKGTRDFFPPQKRIQNWMFQKIQKTVEGFGYEDYMGPVLEPFELYAAKTGEEIVNQQLYWFMDRGERKVAIRPEMTPTLARMVASQVQELPKPIRWYCIPNFYRYERPQRGRLREFYQLNVDILGGNPILADAEILQLAYEIISQFGGGNKISVRVNHRKLMDYFFKTHLALNDETTTAVIKLCDAIGKMKPEEFQQKVTALGISEKQLQEIRQFFGSDFNGIQKLFPCEGTEILSQVFSQLQLMGFQQAGQAHGQIVFDPTIMRGLDYYTGTVFEIFDSSPENNRAMFGGGRYDNLIGLFGKHSVSGVGFGMGDVTLQNFLETHQLLPQIDREVDFCVSLPSAFTEPALQKEMMTKAFAISKLLRERGKNVVMALEEMNFGNALKWAVKMSAKKIILFGQLEAKEGKIIVKDLSSKTQDILPISQI